MSLITGRGMQAFLGFPRPRGDEPDRTMNTETTTEFSPPARG